MFVLQTHLRSHMLVSYQEGQGGFLFLTCILSFLSVCYFSALKKIDALKQSSANAEFNHDMISKAF